MYDVVVVGGGPGGSAAAAALAHAGLSVLMVDRRGLVGGAYQQLKPCGGGMDGGFFHHLPPQTTRAEAVEALSEHQVYALVAHTPHGPTGEIKATTGEPILHLGMRTRIDGFLARKAVECGAAYVQDRVARVRPAPGGFVVVGACNSYGARYVIGADGAYGVTGRSLGLAPRLSLYLASEWECETDPQTWGRWEGKSLIEPSVAPFGYGWIFPKRPCHLSIGWGLPFRMGRRLNAMTANLFREHGVSGEIKRTAHWIPFYSGGAVAAGGAYLVGDAAGLCNPTNGGGITPAMWSGRRAAEAIIAGDGAASYGAAVRSLTRRYRLGRAMRNVIIARMCFGQRGFVRSRGWEWFIEDLQGRLSYGDWARHHPWRALLGLALDPVVERIIARPGGAQW